MWVLGVCLLVITIVWSFVAAKNQKHNSARLIEKHNIPPSMLLMDRLGFNIENQIAIFANWQSTYCFTERIEDEIIRGERKSTDISIDIPIGDIKNFEIEDSTVNNGDKRLIVNFNNIRAYSGIEFSDRAWTLIPFTEVEAATMLIESVGIKIHKTKFSL